MILSANDANEMAAIFEGADLRSPVCHPGFAGVVNGVPKATILVDLHFELSISPDGPATTFDRFGNWLCSVDPDRAALRALHDDELSPEEVS